MLATACTACKTRFRVKHALAGKTIECPKCGARFKVEPPAHGDVRDRRKAMWIGGAAFGLLLLGTFAYVMTRDLSVAPTAEEVAEEEARKTAAAAPKVVVPPAPPPAGSELELLERARKVVEGLRTEDDLELPALLDHEERHAQRRAAGAETKVWLELSPEEQYERQVAFFEELRGDERQRQFLKASVPKDILIVSQQGDLAEVSLRLFNALEESSQDATLRFKLRGSWRLYAFERALIEVPRVAGAGAQLVASSELKPREDRVRAPPVPEKVQPLAETSLSMRGAIQGALIELRDPAATATASKSRSTLAAAGKHAIPYLLNELVDLDLADPQQLIVAARLTGTLSDITGVDYPIFPGGVEGSMLGARSEDNTMNRRLWFGWWRDNGKSFVAAEAQPDATQEPERP